MQRPDRSFALSCVFHLFLVAALAFGLHWPDDRPAAATVVSIKAVAIDQSVIDAQTEVLEQAQRERDEAAQRVEAEQVEAEKEKTRLAKVEEDKKRAAAAKVETDRKAEIQRQEDEQRRLKAALDKKAADEQAQRDRAAALKIKQAEEQRIAEQKRKDELEQQQRAEQKRKEEEEKKRVAEEKRKAAAERKRVAEQQRKAAQDRREAQLNEMLEMEQQRLTAVDGGLLNEYMALVQQHLRRNWNLPSSVQDDLKCTVIVKQIPGGVVIDVQIKSCNGDQAVARSIEAAVYKSSPLPEPPDPSLFERVLEIVFVPPKSP